MQISKKTIAQSMLFVTVLISSCNSVYQEKQNEKDLLWELTAVTTDTSRHIEYLCILANFESETSESCLNIQKIFESAEKDRNHILYKTLFSILSRAVLENKNGYFFKFYTDFYPGEYLNEIKVDCIVRFAAESPDIFFKMESPKEILDSAIGQPFFSTKAEGEFLCNSFEKYGKNTSHINYALAQEYAIIIRNILNSEFHKDN